MILFIWKFRKRNPNYSNRKPISGCFKGARGNLKGLEGTF
jgi:hypothetical protein